jgi:CBS domain containing-hemolysin-like protein
LDTFFRLFLVLLLVLANAFFVAAEFSIVTIRRTRVEQLVADRHPLAVSLRRAVLHPAPFIATTQIGVTMASLALGWLGEPVVAAIIEPLLAFLPRLLAQLTANSVATALAFILITTVSILLGELIPKSLALQRPEAVAFVAVQPMLLLQTIFRPFVWLLTSGGSLGLRLFGLSAPASHGLVYSVDELKMLVAASRQAGVLEESEQDIIERVFHFADIHAHEVMVPRTDMVTVPIQATVANVLDLGGKSAYSRFPVYETTVDNVIGVIYVVDLLRRLDRAEFRRAPIRPFLREALLLPETITVDVLIERMRQQHTHLAILLDEYGGTAGLVTLMDVLERIVGQVPDQLEAPAPLLTKLPDGSILVGGLTNLDELAEETGLVLDSDTYDTIGGFVLGEIGRRPEVGDRVTHDGAIFQVEAIDGLRIAQVRIWPSASSREEPETPSSGASL